MAAYGLLISGGGVAAYLNTGSKPSAISGVISGVILAVAYAKNNIPIALATAVLLTIVFGVRVVKTKKLVPSGVLLAISVVAAALFAAALA